MKGDSVTIHIERENESSGQNPSLWVYYVDEAGNKKALREVTWAFASERLLDTLLIGVYVARPTKQGEDDAKSLSVHFTNFELNAEVL